MVGDGGHGRVREKATGGLVKGGLVESGQRQGPRGSHPGQSEQQATYRVQGF